MGTNYYMTVNACQHCGRGEGELHIGKSSAGWVFSLNTHPDHNIHDLASWRTLWPHNRIRDEYGQAISVAEMERIVCDRHWDRPSNKPPYGYASAEDFCARNSANPGPNGLWRHKVDGRHCIAHGEGTYDLMRGEFW